MSDQFLGEIRIFSCNFAPYGWAFCNGQILPISQYSALFSLLGTTYGGDGRSNFALPNLQGSAPMDWGSGAGLSPHFLGETGGSPTVTLLETELPLHSHAGGCNSGEGSQTSPAGAVFAAASGGRTPPPYYSDAAPTVQMSTTALGVTGGNQPHNNLQPYLTLNFCIALQGIYPTRG
jgi:microcystin-dependent protein